MRSRSRIGQAIRRTGVTRSIMSFAVILGAVASSLPVTAWAGDFASGAMLARACSSRNPGESSLCDGYIAGALDVVAGSAELRSKICVPPNTKLSALREAVGRFGQGHVDETKASGLALLSATMRADYPCPAK